MEITNVNEEVAARRINDLLAAINHQQAILPSQQTENGLYYLSSGIEFNEAIQTDQARAAYNKVVQHLKEVLPILNIANQDEH